jgi:hypothetical protein
MGKFGQFTAAYADGIEQLINRAMRRGLLKGLEAAVENTTHDSSNAAYHWLLAASRSRPGMRAEGQLTDRRGIAPVGKRGDKGQRRHAVASAVRQRETQKVLDKFLVGRKPDAKWGFYNAVLSDETYAGNANIEEAGEAALEAVALAIEDEITKGNARRRPL